MDDLRKRAEKALQDFIIRPEEYSPEAAKRLIHELRVYQMELELQNEELRQTQQELRESRKRYVDLYDFAPVGYLTVNEKGRITQVNLTCTAMLGRERTALLKRFMDHLIVKEDQDIYYLHRRKILNTKKPQSCDIRMQRKDGSLFYAHLECAPVLDDKENVTHILVAITNITERKRAEEQLKALLEAKNALLQEVQHRTRNNMQVLSALLGMHLQSLDDDPTRHFLKGFQDRIEAMSLVHQQLHREDLMMVDLHAYIEDSVQGLLSHYPEYSDRISFTFDTDAIAMTIDPAVPFGLLLNEVISNALKHAFPEGGTGTIHVSLHTTGTGQRELRVRDNGVGLPEDFDPDQDTSLGVQLITILAQQLQGSVEFHRQEPGTEVIVRFKELYYKRRI